MNFNATLIGQSITFIVFVWFCMRFVWPPIMTRAYRSVRRRSPKAWPRQIVANTNRNWRSKKAAGNSCTRPSSRLPKLSAVPKNVLRTSSKRRRTRLSKKAIVLKAAAQAEIEQEVNRAKETLRGQVVEIATAGAGRILKRELDATANDELIKDLVAQI